LWTMTLLENIHYILEIAFYLETQEV
jgi:hypothetical protein